MSNELKNKIDQMFKTFKKTYGVELDEKTATLIVEEYIKEHRKQFVIDFITDQPDKTDLERCLNILKDSSWKVTQMELEAPKKEPKLAKAKKKRKTKAAKKAKKK